MVGKLVGKLLSCGTDINTTDSYDYRETPLLTIAAARNHEGAVDVILAAGAGLGQDRTGKFPLHAATIGGH